MKEKEAKIDFREHQLVLYVEKKDGSYGPVQTGSYISKNYIDDYWYKRGNLEREYREMVCRGDISPIAYYMTVEELTPSELAGRVDMSVRQVKKHLKPEHFGKLTIDQLMRYCAVFNVRPARMFQAITLNSKKIKLTEEKTANRLFDIIHAEVVKK
jgi:hypothetical protein